MRRHYVTFRRVVGPPRRCKYDRVHRAARERDQRGR